MSWDAESQAQGETLRRLTEDNRLLREQLTAGDTKVLRCAFCGEPYPEGTPTHKHEALAAHIKVCKVHPVGIENRRMREDLRQISRISSRLLYALHGPKLDGPRNETEKVLIDIDQICIDALNGEPANYPDDEAGQAD
jgi:hypothetical protein